MLPFIKISTDKASPIQAPLMMLEEALTEKETTVNSSPKTNIYISEIPFVETTYKETPKEPIEVGTILLYSYLLGLAINIIILSKSVYLMISLIRRGKKKAYMNNYTLVLISEDIVPFSWGQYIVLSQSDYKNNPDEIIIHEMSHAKHRHSVDLIFMELILLFQWFNPAVWLLKRELKDIHEYQADISVLQSGIDATKYQLLLVKKAVGASSYTLANSFNHSKIKKRITMMLKIRSNKWARLKLLMLLPLGTITVFAFARPNVNEPLSSLVEYESTNILSDIKIPGEEVIRFTPPVIMQDTTPKRTIKYTPPQTKKANTKNSNNTKIMRDDPPPPPPIKKESDKKSEVIIVEDVDGKKAADKKAPPPPPIKKTSTKNNNNVKIVRDDPPPPPPIKKESDKKGETVIIEVEDVEGKKAADKKAPPPPPIKKANTKYKKSEVVIVKDEPQTEEVVVVGYGKNKKN